MSSESKYDELNKEAKKYIEEKNYKKAEEIYNEAIKYDKKAYVQIAYLYYEYIDEIEGKEKFKTAYEKGNLKVADHLGVFEYQKGNLEKAKEWYKIAAKNGDFMAQYNLALQLEKEGNLKEALELHEKSANNKFFKAMWKLVLYYEENKNIEKTLYWLEKIKNTQGIGGYDLEDKEKVDKLYQKIKN